MKKKLFILLLIITSIVNVKAYENEIFKFDVPDKFTEEKIEDKSNVYKWSYESKDDVNSILITVDKNKEEDKYNIKDYNQEDLDKYTKYIEDNTNAQLKEHNIVVNVKNMKKETINDKMVLSYDSVWPTKKAIGYDTYQKGYTYTTNKYIVSLTYTSNKEIKSDNETLKSVINSFTILDEDIKNDNSFIIKIFITALAIGIIGLLISAILPSKKA